MTFNQPHVFVLLCAVILLLSWDLLRPARRQFLLLISVAFVGLLYNPNPRSLDGSNLGSLGFLLLFVGAHYLVVRTMLTVGRGGWRTAIYYVWFAAAIAVFLVVKQYAWLTGLVVPANRLASDLFTVGLSFLIFRQIHLGVEIRDGMLDQLGFFDYLSYQLAFWTFLAGPIQRFEPFRAQFDAFASSPNAAKAVLLGLNRVMLGYFKMFVFGAYFFEKAIPETFTRRPDATHLVLFLLAYPLYMYLNFSGYCDIVIGIARSASFTLPENFNYPYRARNVVDYWNRWHITLSEFFRDYMYFPIYTSLCRHGPQAGAMVLATLCSFFVMGAWHGNTVSFAVFGLIHGVGVVAVNLYTEVLRKTLSRERLRRYRQSRLVEAGAIAVCQSYVVLAFLPFAYNWAQLSEVYRCFRHWAS